MRIVVFSSIFDLAVIISPLARSQSEQHRS